VRLEHAKLQSELTAKEKELGAMAQHLLQKN
jgi:hypothetical protein